MSSIAEELIPHMRRVHAAEQDLRDLGLVWQMIEASASISCPEEAESILPMLTRTRQRFGSLQGRLVRQLGTELVAELNDELVSTAQCTIDILVRNLFERTADVGFLATDDVIRRFCVADAATRAAGHPALLQRLAEYRAKYTVYDDIIVLDPHGAVLARLDNGAAAAARSADPIVAKALACAGYVERHAASDLGAPGAPALLYGHRIQATDGADGAAGAAGVLVLRFRMGDEMQRIFTSVVAPARQVALTLLDADDRVIASNDESHVPLGARLQTAADGGIALTVFGGREYLSVTRSTSGYQGYAGPGWRAQAMVSLLTAFRSSTADSANEGANNDTAQLTLDNSELARIRAEVDAINADLRRVIWNGRLLAGAGKPVGAQAGAQAGGGSGQARLKAVLRQIQEAGTRTRNRVTLAIGHLYGTSLGRACHQARELARLAADIMDRNLYERANDCRWWALSPLLQRELGAGGDADSTALNAMLAHVNALYTVYTRLVVFDADGRIRGVSRDAGTSLIGQSIGADLRAATATLVDSQRYAVSAFAASAISDGVPTYVYLAGVRDGGRLLGGIAIVFNAEREFRAMLDDVLAGRDGVAAFVDAEGRVIASTAGGPAIGEPLPFTGTAPVADHAGTRYACADVAATGYREFKSNDGYCNGVRAVVALRLGVSERRQTALFDNPVQPLPALSAAPPQEFAIFQVGANRLGLPAGVVLEARAIAGLVHAPIGLPHAAGLLEVATPQGPAMIPVLCGRSIFGVAYAARDTDGVLLVLARPGAPGQAALALRVDDVLSVVDSDSGHLQPAPGGLRGQPPLLAGLLRLGLIGAEGEVLAQIIDGAALASLLPRRRQQEIAAGEAMAVA